jgi:hypothetical protein
MKKLLTIFIILLVYSFNGYSQIEKNTIQIGASALPIYDIFKIAPKNSIAGFGVTTNIGFFPIKNLSVGVSPYYAQVLNGYDYSTYYSTIRKEEHLKFYGLNMYIRYYIFSIKKFSFYASLQAGFGNLSKKVFNAENQQLVSTDNSSVFISSLGVGVNYFLKEKIALELNVPYLDVHNFSLTGINFKTIAPTIGVQFFLK